MKAAFAVVCVLSACSSPGSNIEAPPAWIVDGPGAWSFGTDADGAATIVVDAHGGKEGAFNLLLSSAIHGPDVDITTRIHAEDGAIDQGGGLVWRAQDAHNYYLARWNPLEDNLRLYTVRDGARRLLVSLDTPLDRDAWHEMRAVMQGSAVMVAVDKRFVLSFVDTTFLRAGAIGLWSKADASTTFEAPILRDR